VWSGYARGENVAAWPMCSTFRDHMHTERGTRDHDAVAEGFSVHRALGE
jgi:hypothetical protein